METKTVKILFRHPNKNVRELPPKVLEWDDHKKERHFFEPNLVGNKTVYEVPEAYGRLLLSRQPDRYFLLEPKRLLCKFPSRDGLSSESRVVETVMGTKKFAQFESESEAEQKPRDDTRKLSEKEEGDLEKTESDAANKAKKAEHDDKQHGKATPHGHGHP